MTDAAFAGEWDQDWWVTTSNAAIANAQSGPFAQPGQSAADPCTTARNTVLANYNTPGYPAPHCAFSGAYPQFHNWKIAEIVNVGHALSGGTEVMNMYIHTPGSWPYGVRLGGVDCAGWCLNIGAPDQYDTLLSTVIASYNPDILSESWANTNCTYYCGSDTLFGWECAPYWGSTCTQAVWYARDPRGRHGTYYSKYFKALRRHAHVADAAMSEFAGVASRALAAAPVPGGYAAQPQSATIVASGDGVEAGLMATRLGICLMVLSGSDSAACVSKAHALAGGAVQVANVVPFPVVVGVLPDGAHHVVVVDGDGTRNPVAVNSSGGFALVTGDPESVSFDDAAGATHTAKLR